LWGADYIEFLATGRGKTNKKGNGVATKKIFEWVEKKLAPLLGISDEDEIESLKYAVAAKIHRFGTQVYRKERAGINIDAIISNLEVRISNSIAENAKKDIIKRLDKYTELFKSHNYKI